MARKKSEIALRESVHQYGKQTYSEKEQISILYFILEDAKNKLVKDSEIYKLIAENQLKFEDKENLKETIRIVNTFVIALEAKDQDGTTVNYLKKHGFYRILYRNPQILGKELPQDDILHKILRLGFIGVATSAFIILLFTATVLFSAPFWLTSIATGLFVGASTYLSGILYGVVNDLFATHFNLPYFLLGHQPQQKSLLRTNDKVAQGIAWGIAGSFALVVIATMIFTVAATITAFFVPIATFILPVMMIAMPLIALGAELYARKKAREYIKIDEKKFLVIGANKYQREGLEFMCPTKSERASWYANSDRNVFGFKKMPLISLAALVVLIMLSALSMFLPSILFASQVIAMVIPAVFAAVACVTLLGAGVYMYINRHKQIDDRYRLEFKRAEIEPNLYLDEDMTYVQSLIKNYSKQGPSIDLNPSSNHSNNNEAFFNRKPTDITSMNKQEEPHEEHKARLGYSS